MRLVIHVVGLLMVCASGFCKETRPPLKNVDMPTLDTKDPPAVMLYTIPGMEPLTPPPPPGQPYSPPNYEFNRVQVAAWSDGRIVWSHDLKRGGSPYFTGKVDPAKVLEVYRVLEEETSATEHKHTSHTIPDAASQNIVMLSENGETGIEWRSSHPNFEANKKVVYTSRGVSSSENYKPTDPPAKEEAEFQLFRRDFDRIKAAILALPPGKELRFK